MPGHSFANGNFLKIFVSFLFITVQAQSGPCPQCPCPWYETGGNNNTQTFHKNTVKGCHEICDTTNGCMSCCLDCCESNVTSCYGWSWSKELGCMAESGPPPSERTGIVHGYHAICYDMMNPGQPDSNGECPPCPCLESPQSETFNELAKITTTKIPFACPTCDCDWIPPEDHPLRKLHPLALPGCAPLCENDLECMTCCDSCCYKNMDSCLGFAWSRQLKCMKASKSRQSRALGVFEILGVHAMCNEISQPSLANVATCPPCFCPFSTTTKTTTTTTATTTIKPKDCPICPCQNRSSSIAPNEPSLPLGCDLACQNSQSCIDCCDDCCYNDYKSCSGFHWSKGLGCQSDNRARAAFQIEGIHVVCNALVHHQVDQNGNCPTCDCITNEPSTPIVQTSPRPIKEESNVTSNSNQDQSSLSTLSSRPVNDSQEILATTSVSPNLETTLLCPPCPCSTTNNQPDPKKVAEFYSSGCTKTCSNVTECVDCCMNCCGRSSTCLGFAWAEELGCLVGKKSKGAFQINGVHAICQAFSPDEEELSDICPVCSCNNTTEPLKLSTSNVSKTDQPLTIAQNVSKLPSPIELSTSQTIFNSKSSSPTKSSSLAETSKDNMESTVSNPSITKQSSSTSSEAITSSSNIPDAGTSIQPSFEPSKSSIPPTLKTSNNSEQSSVPVEGSTTPIKSEQPSSSNKPLINSTPVQNQTETSNLVPSSSTLITTTPTGQVCPPCPCLNNSIIGAGSTTSFRLSTCLSICSNDLECQKCCDGCCHNPDKHCIGFAYSSVLGCLKPKSMKGVAQVFGIHALCEDVPDDPSFSVQVTPTCPSCPCLTSTPIQSSSTEANVKETTTAEVPTKESTTTTAEVITSSTVVTTVLLTQAQTSTTIFTTKGKVCEPCPCQSADVASSPQSTSISGCGQVCGDGESECLECCESCCFEESSSCKGFAFSEHLGCLKSKKTKSILEIPGKHAICSSIPPSINISLQVANECPPCNCSSTTEGTNQNFWSTKTPTVGPSDIFTQDIEYPTTLEVNSSTLKEVTGQPSSSTENNSNGTSPSPIPTNSSVNGPSSTEGSSSPPGCKSCNNGLSRPYPIDVFSEESLMVNSRGDFIFETGTFQLTTPNYPFCAYANNLNWTWKFQLKANETIQVKVLELKLEESESCANDALRLIGFRSTNIDPRLQCSKGTLETIHNGFSMCGHVVSRTFESDEDKVSIQFESNDSGTNAGFILLLTVV